MADMATKRKRKSTEIQVSGLSITDLPMAILVEIVVKLSTKTIIFCKCVCKAWRTLISDPEFAKLHLARSKTFLLIRDYQKFRISRALYLLEPEDGLDFDGYCWCSLRTCARCHHRIKVTTKLKIPIRNAQVMLSRLGDDPNNSDVVFGPKRNNRRKDFVYIKSRNDHIYRDVVSCNGLLCLSDKFGPDPIVVCNPITGEFIHLPEPSSREKNDTEFVLGFGFCPKNDQYKVVRTYVEWITDPVSRVSWLAEGMAEVHTLGTDSWRNVDATVFQQKFVDPPTYLDGALHWFCFGNTQDSCFIIFFNLDEEQFHFFSLPSQICSGGASKYRVMGVLRGFLCIYDNSSEDTLHIWAMKEYGVYDSWTKFFSVDTNMLPLWWGKNQIFQPISSPNNGGLLIFPKLRCVMIYFDESRGAGYKYFWINNRSLKLEVMAYTPSFISLKDVVKEKNVEVLNVYTRCGKIKLLEELYQPLFFGRCWR